MTTSSEAVAGLAERLRAGLEGLPAEPWHLVEYERVRPRYWIVTNPDSWVHRVAAIPDYPDRPAAALAAYIALCSPGNILLLLDALAAHPVREGQEGKAGKADGRTLTGETCMGMPVAAWMVEGEYGPQFATHWSTHREHEKPERLFREADIRAALASQPDAAVEIKELTRERDEARKLVNQLNEDITFLRKRRGDLVREKDGLEAELAALKAETDARVKAAVEAAYEDAASYLDAMTRRWAQLYAEGCAKIADQIRARAAQADLGQEGQGG